MKGIKLKYLKYVLLLFLFVSTAEIVWYIKTQKIKVISDFRIKSNAKTYKMT